jgi:hypothetical protein
MSKSDQFSNNLDFSPFFFPIDITVSNLSELNVVAPTKSFSFNWEMVTGYQFKIAL